MDRPSTNVNPETVHGWNSYLDDVFNTALTNRQKPHTLGTRDLIKGFLLEAFKKGHNYYERPIAVDSLSGVFSGERWRSLFLQPTLPTLLEDLKREIESAEDYEYFLALDDRGHIVFRLASILDDYAQSTESGLVIPQRAILTHFKDQFGGFTVDEIEELEQLINNPKAKEAEFQQFFEDHTHFLRMNDYREVYSQTILFRPDPHGPLIPDFILTDRELQRAAIVDLKLPTAKVIVGTENRRRFSAAIMEARQQLLEYSKWFRERENRQALVCRIGMEVYEPMLIVIIGRASEFRTPFERQNLATDNASLKVVTYDDIIMSAKRRRVIISSAG
jgi:hypothetical protein